MGNLSDFDNVESSNSGSKMSLFGAICPFDTTVNEETKTATITSAGKDIYFVDGKITTSGSYQATFGFLKGNKEYTFLHWYNDWEGKTEGVKLAIGISVINMIKLLIGRNLEIAGKDNFEYNNFQEFAEGLFQKITPKLHKIAMALEFKNEEQEYINYRLANLVEIDIVDNKEVRIFHPNIGLNPNDLRIDLLINTTMSFPEEENQDEDGVTENDTLETEVLGENDLAALLDN
jgi:hypothetical protein